MVSHIIIVSSIFTCTRLRPIALLAGLAMDKTRFNINIFQAYKCSWVLTTKAGHNIKKLRETTISLSPTNTLPISFRSVECLYHGTSPSEEYIVWQACALYIRNFGYWVAQSQTTPHLLRRTEAWQVLQMEPDFNIDLHNLNLLSCYCASFCKILKHLLSICCVRLVSNIISSHQKWISGTWNCKKRVICWAVRAEATWEGSEFKKLRPIWQSPRVTFSVALNMCKHCEFGTVISKSPSFQIIKSTT